MYMFDIWIMITKSGTDHVRSGTDIAMLRCCGVGSDMDGWSEQVLEPLLDEQARRQPAGRAGVPEAADATGYR